jgi:hypothetical protein
MTNADYNNLVSGLDLSKQCVEHVSGIEHSYQPRLVIQDRNILQMPLLYERPNIAQ